MPNKINWSGAISRALAEGITPVQMGAPTLWKVAASTIGSSYLLRIKDDIVTCTCKGYEHRNYCKHAAAMYIHPEVGTTLVIPITEEE